MKKPGNAGGAEKGSPQGGLISPLLANIYLNPLDWLMEELGFKSVRYADGIIVLAQSAEGATAALDRIAGWMEGAGLQLHPDKTRLVDMSQADAYIDFLGYRFKRSKRGRLMRLVRPKSKRKLREALKKHTKRCNAHSMECTIAKVNIHLPGWYGYFKQAEPSELGEWTDGYECACVPSFGNGGRAKGAAVEKITTDGQTATSRS